VTLTLPEPQAVLDLLAMFIGERPPLRHCAGIDLTYPPSGTYVTWLKDAQDEVEGAIVADLATSLYLGGELIMMPEATLREMWSEGRASEAVLDGLGEVFNNLRGLLNRIAVNPHVTPTEPEAYHAPAPGSGTEWLLNPSHRVDLAGQTAFGPGFLVLLGK